MADEICKIVNATTTSTVVVDLNEVASATGIRMLHCVPTDHPMLESEGVGYDSPGGLILKQQDLWIPWDISLRYPDQTTTANLITKINSVGSACKSNANALMIQRVGEATPRYFNIVSTNIRPALEKELADLHFNAQKMIPHWPFVVRTHPFAQGSSTPAWY